MPIETVIGLSVIFAMFGAFILGLGSVSLWVALGDRRDKARAPDAPAQAFDYRKAA